MLAKMSQDQDQDQDQDNKSPNENITVSCLNIAGYDFFIASRAELFS